ncbi:MAG: hypothetical protein ABUT39_03745, partial [Acidobacteriota bacterium]
MQTGTLRTAPLLLALAGTLLAPALHGEELTGAQRLVASSVQQGVDDMAALPDVLVLRQGSTLLGLDPYSLQQLWVYHGTELIAGPFAVGERLFVIQRDVKESKSGQTIYHSILEIRPASGLLQGQQQTISSSTWVLSGCEKAVFLLDDSMFAVLGTKPVSPVFPARRLKRDLARAFDPLRISLAGSHLLAWVPELRLEVSFDLERNAQAWRRGFPEEIVDVKGCGSVQVATTAGGNLLGLDARTGETLWQSPRPEGPPIHLLLQSGQSLALAPGVLPGWVNLKDGSVHTLPGSLPAEELNPPRNLLEDGHGWVL